jgi:hypothetical protein
LFHFVETNMKTKALVGSILMTAATLAMGTSARGADNFEVGLKKAVPNGTFKAVHSETVVGTKIQTYEVMVPGQPTGYATVTENGDLLASANPKTAADLPPAVAEVTTNLFGNPPTKLWATTVVEYTVNVKTASGQVYGLKINAAGLISGIDSNQELAYSDPRTAPKADPAEAAGIDKLVEQHYPGAKVASVNKSLNAAGFYVVEFTQGNESGYVVINKENRIRSTSIQVPTSSVPKPVLATVGDIKGATITGVSKYTYNFWEATETVSGDTITLRARPDGSVIEIDSQTQKALKESVKAKTGR